MGGRDRAKFVTTKDGLSLLAGAIHLLLMACNGSFPISQYNNPNRNKQGEIKYRSSRRSSKGWELEQQKSS
jgi:hypothetical protein